MSRIYVVAGQSNALRIGERNNLEKALSGDPNEKIFIKKYQGGTSLNHDSDHPDWFPITDGDSTTGELYDQTLALIDATLQRLPASTLGGFLWVQGERDARDMADAEQYFTLLEKLTLNLQQRYGDGFSFTILQLSDQMPALNSNLYPGAEVVREAQQELGGKYDFINLLDPDLIFENAGYDFSSVVEDDLHYNETGSQLIADAYVEQMIDDNNSDQGTVTGTIEDDVITQWTSVDPDGDVINDEGQVIEGLSGDDYIIAGSGKDLIFGGTGDDTVLSGDGDDTIFLGEGDDVFIDSEQPGINAKDLVFGEAGNDSLQGAGGKDTLDGGTGSDILTGGLNADTFVFASGDGLDKITDFLVGEDMLLINGTNIDPSKLPAGVSAAVAGGDVVLSYGPGDAIRIEGASIADWQPQKNDAIGEAGSLIFTQNSESEWISVSFTETIEQAVVVLGPLTLNGVQPATTRVRNVTEKGFEFQLDEWDYLDGRHLTETIGWLAVSQGTHVLSNGHKIVAGNVTAGKAFGLESFGTSLNNPIVFAELSSTNDASAAAPRLKSITGDSFKIQIEREEANLTDASESVGWIAIETGTSTGFEAVRTDNIVNDRPTNFVFDQTFSGAPILLADMQTANGWDPSVARMASLSENAVSLFVEEETSFDEELRHVQEVMGFLALENGYLL